MKRIDSLPCFYYIIASFKDGDTKQQASFALSYIHYLQKEKKALPVQIEQGLSKLVLLAQFSNAGRVTPLDFLTLEGCTYHLTDDASLSAYTDALYQVCGRPLSFRDLFSKTDKNQSPSICHLCPYSKNYCNAEEKTEVSFARTILEKDDFFLSLKPDDIPKIFRSYYELSDLIPNIRKPIAFPALECLITAVQIHAADYFGGFFSKDYTVIADSFRKQLSKYGVRKNTCSNLQAYDSMIYDSLLRLLSTAELCEVQEIYQALLSDRDYTPPFLADFIPALPKTDGASKKKERKKKGVSQEEPIYPSHAGAVLDSVVNSAVIPLLSLNDGALDGYKPKSNIGSKIDSNLGSNMGSKTDSNLDDNTFCKDEEVTVTNADAAQIDVINTSGEIIHAGERKGIPCYDADMGSLYEAGEWDEDWEDLSDEETEQVQDEEPYADISIEEPAADPPVQDDAELMQFPKQNTKNGLVSLPENMPFFTDKHITSDIYKVPDMPSSDRMTSFIKSAGYCILEPVLLNKQCCLCILHGESIYMVPFTQKELIQPLLKDKKIIKATLFPFALYGTCRQYSISLKNVYPLAELAIRSGIYAGDFPKDLAGQLMYAKNIYTLCQKSESAAALLPKTAALTEALGNSFYRSRFLHMTGNCYLVGYTEDGISCTPYSYRGEKGELNGYVYTYTFLKQYPPKQYKNLIERLLVYMSEHGLFRQLNVAVLSMTTVSVSFFMDKACQDYLTTVISSYIFSTAYEMGLKNIDFRVMSSTVAAK